MTQLFRQKINFVELTKLLERDTCDTLTFTYGMGHDYSTNVNVVYPVVKSYWQRLDGSTWTDWKESDEYIKNFAFEMPNGYDYKSPKAYSLPFNIAPIQIFRVAVSRVMLSTNVTISSSGQTENLGVVYGNETTLTPTYTPTKPEYTISYTAQYEDRDIGTLKNFRYKLVVSYTLDALQASPKKQIPSITDVVNRILNVGLVRREGELPKYKLDPAFAEKYANVEAPEFFITRCTLREALLQVGGYIHAEPRLLFNDTTQEPDLITFDELGSDEEYTLPVYIKGALTYDSETNPNEYCGQLDSYVDNLVNTTNPQEGTIVEPSPFAYITPRTESVGLAISDNTALIRTELPIYRVTKLEMGYVKKSDGTVVEVGDITPYLFEKAEYDTLTGYDGQYPYAKKYAFCYAQGDNQITGLGLKAETIKALGFSEAFQDFAAYNVAQSQLGYNVPKDGIANMAFRVTYIPLMSARVKQRKAYRDRPLDNTLFFNQGANTVEASYYGESMKGNLMKVGNELEARTYMFRRYDDLPKCGQIFKGKYIVKIDIEFEQNFILATIYTSTYNKLSQYVGLKSNYRLYDVSERQTVARHINYSENVIIGDNEPQNKQTSITRNGIGAFYYGLVGGAFRPVMNTVAQLRRKDKTAIQYPTLHSALSVAMGNSLLFAWQFEDNFSAGSQATFLSSAKKIQKYAPYGNEYGEGYYLAFGLSNTGAIATSWNDQISTASAQGMCDKLPIIADRYFNEDGGIMFDFRTFPLIVDKDSREALHVATQIHFVANRPEIVFGSLLGHNNPLVSGAQDGATRQLILLPRRINALNDIVNVQGAYTVSTGGLNAYIDNSAASKQIVINAITNPTTETFKSWAIIDSVTKRLYIGENIELPPNGKSEPIYFNF